MVTSRVKKQCHICGSLTSRLDEPTGIHQCERCAGLVRLLEPLRSVDFSGALCAEVDPELWFPGVGESGKDAKRICERCPVRERCESYATEAMEQYGIWGGKTSRQLRKQRRNEAQPPTTQGRTA